VRIPIIIIRVTKKVKKVKIQERNSRVFLRSFPSKYSLKVGIKATEIDPSAKRRRNRFGSRKATEKASDSALVPRKLALVISLKRPRIRENNVSRDRAEPCRTREPADRDRAEPCLGTEPKLELSPFAALGTELAEFESVSTSGTELTDSIPSTFFPIITL
jgi:hypothetical protein